jgi:3-methyladenine DNA glycosylase AlkD
MSSLKLFLTNDLKKWNKKKATKSFTLNKSRPSMPQLLLSRIEVSLEKNKNAANVPWMEAYMKNNFVFYGIKKPTLNIVFTAYKNEIKQLPAAAFWELIQQLWLKPQREFHYFAMLALLGYKKNLQQKDLLTLEWLLTQHAWWDSVDLLATHLVGAYFKKFPEEIEPTLQKWIDSQNL